MRINFYEPWIDKLELNYVNKCIRSKIISGINGPIINRFEKNFSKFIKIKYSSTVANGTVGLHLALLALNIGKNDEVIVPDFTYIATANCVKYVGAKIKIVDINKYDWQICLDDLRKKISKSTKAVIVPHIFGYVTNFEKLLELKKKYNFFLIEDCAEAFGSYYHKNKHVGTLSDISVFSFFSSKTITTGEGGMICTNKKKIIERVNLLKNQGVDIKKQRSKKHYWHSVLGYNYRLTNLQASIGLAQLKKAKKILQLKKKVFQLYKKNINSSLVSFAVVNRNTKSSYWAVVIKLKKTKYRNKLLMFLKKNNVDARPVFLPVSSMPMYKNLKLKNAKNTVELSNSSLMLPSYPKLKLNEIKYICKKINLFFYDHNLFNYNKY